MNRRLKLIGKTKYFLIKCKRDNISAIAAQSAFFLVLSIIPFLMFAFAILSFFNIPKDLYETYLEQAVSGELGTNLKTFIDTAYSHSVGIAFTTIIIALWSAGKGLYSITDGISRIYKIKKDRFWLVKRIFAMGYTFLMFIVMVVNVGILILAEFFDGLIKPFVKNMPYAVGILYSLRYLVVFAIVLLLVSFALKLYLRNKVSDRRWAKFRLQLPGVILTALAWIALSYGIRIYVKYFNGFSIYGSLTTIIVVMIWFYFSMYILLYGIQFNYIMRREIYNFSFKKLFKKKD